MAVGEGSNVFCPQCGAKRLGNYRFCTTCRFDYDTAGAQQPGTQPALSSPAAEPSQRQQLAGAAMTAQTVNLVTWLGAVVGLVAGFLLWGYLGVQLQVLGGIGFFVGFIALPLVGMIVGSRVALLVLRG